MFKLVVVGTVAALAAAQQAPSWGIEQNIMGALGTSVSFVDNNRGYYPMNANGGNTVLETLDGGETWTATNSSVDAVMFLASDAKGENVVASSIFGAVYSLDGGKTFYTGNTLSGGQGVRFSDSKVWMTSGSNYIMSSTTGGWFWDTHSIPELKSTTRYIAAPSDNVVYVTAGTWPQQSGQNAEGAHAFSARWTLSPHAATNQVSAIPTYGKLTSKHAEAIGASTTYQMQIVKSADGGATWTSQFYSDSLNLYPNGIDCYDAEHCCFAAEGDFVAVYCTNDGQNWNQVFNDTSSTLSLTSAAYVGPEEIWIGGGNLSQIDMYAYLLHSTDGGKTWTVHGTDNYGQYPNDLSFVSSSRGWASTFNQVQQSGLMEFKVWSSTNQGQAFLQ